MQSVDKAREREAPISRYSNSSICKHHDQSQHAALADAGPNLLVYKIPFIIKEDEAGAELTQRKTLTARAISSLKHGPLRDRGHITGVPRNRAGSLFFPSCSKTDSFHTQ